jgi:hypothetical protein
MDVTANKKNMERMRVMPIKGNIPEAKDWARKRASWVKLN